MSGAGQYILIDKPRQCCAKVPCSRAQLGGRYYQLPTAQEERGEGELLCSLQVSFDEFDSLAPLVPSLIQGLPIASGPQTCEAKPLRVSAFLTTEAAITYSYEYLSRGTPELAK